MKDQIKKISPKFWLLTLMVFASALVRLLPHPPNFAPIAAIALFGGAYFDKKSLAFVIPLAAMFFTDAIIGFYSSAWLTYVSFALIVVFGIVMLKRITLKNLITATITASLSFFVITNFGVWALGTLYPKTFDGLIQSYIAAIPFFQNSLLGDLFFTAVMFSTYEIVKQKIPALVKVQV